MLRKGDHMSRPMIQAAVTMNQLQQKLDLIGNNLANSQTTGYKKGQAEFSSLLAQQINNMSHPAGAEGRLTPDGVRVGAGARLGSTMHDFSRGTVTETDRPLDVALQGDNHLFQIAVEENGVTDTRYTRDGSFYLQPVGTTGEVMLVTNHGHPVLGETGPITFQDGFDDISIQPNGDIHVTRNNQTEAEGRLNIVETDVPQLLEATKNNAFRLPNLAELGYTLNEVMNEVAGNENLLQAGALEQANVDMASEMSDLLTAQRSYQMNARTISMGDQMMGLINQLR